MKVCRHCNGTGNAGTRCLAASDEYGCIGCGGAGYTCWQNSAIRVVILCVFALIGWFLVQT